MADGATRLIDKGQERGTIVMTSGTAAVETDVSGELREFRSGIVGWMKSYGAAQRLPFPAPTVEGAAMASLQGWSHVYFGRADAARAGCPANDPS
jgi:hypothetical protein